jgi:hypothetical protein
MQEVSAHQKSPTCISGQRQYTGGCSGCNPPLHSFQRQTTCRFHSAAPAATTDHWIVKGIIGRRFDWPKKKKS